MLKKFCKSPSKELTLTIFSQVLFALQHELQQGNVQCQDMPSLIMV